MLGDSDDDGLFGMEGGTTSEESDLGPDVPSVDPPEAPSVDSTDAPSTDVPSVEMPSDDVPGDLKAAFWTLVIIANGVVLAFSLGLMFIGFRGNWELGGRLLIAAGLLAFLGWRVHRRYERRDE
ncbi:hypothetical protein G9464_07285 [Halostella sp. JP-L12]|uniref:DUF7322 domain-containing protein n=1 Tax=Halostella TaxID=1843185 RepID=UPI000EF8244D|nr:MULTISPECIES: hypothetical protein [Halostella]NHN47397.1 hypothetical protein [Halostella sp. JP-L12]